MIAETGGLSLISLKTRGFTRPTGIAHKRGGCERALISQRTKAALRTAKALPETRQSKRRHRPRGGHSRAQGQCGPSRRGGDGVASRRGPDQRSGPGARGAIFNPNASQTTNALSESRKTSFALGGEVVADF